MFLKTDQVPLFIACQTLLPYQYLEVIKQFPTLAKVTHLLLNSTSFAPNQVIEQQVLHLLQLLLELSLLELCNLFKCDIEIFENHILLAGIAILLERIEPVVTFKQVKHLVDLPPANHELVQVLVQRYLGMTV